MFYSKYLKPLLDFILSIGGFIILLPIFVIVLIILLIANNGKAFFFQLRPGLHEKIFKVIKFKTMNDKKDKNGKLLPDEKRLTVVGKFIRKTSLDEIPQLLNVIKSDMSLIGPRPLLIEYLPLYDEIQKRRYKVKPGITGWAQVNGRNAISREQKFNYEVWYVDHLSFFLDLRIFFLTLKKFLDQKELILQLLRQWKSLRVLKVVIIRFISNSINGRYLLYIRSEWAFKSHY